MSHFTTITSQVKDIPMLRLACEEVGVQLLSGVKARGYGSQLTECEHCIRWEGSPYDVAVIKQQDGTYSLMADFYQGHVAKKLGHAQGKNEVELNLGKMMQIYAKNTVLSSAYQNNMYIAGQETTADGQVVLRLATY